MMRPGDTIVEVLLATVVLSIVLAGAFNLSNKAIQTGQSSLERTEAVNIVRDYAESLNYIHGTETDGYNQVWQDIVADASSSPPSYVDEYYCDISVTNPKYIDLSSIGGDPTSSTIVHNFSLPEVDDVLQYSDATDHNPNDLFAVWIEVYDPEPSISSVVDIHIRACWDRLGGSIVDRVGSVVRLSETREL